MFSVVPLLHKTQMNSDGHQMQIQTRVHFVIRCSLSNVNGVSSSSIRLNRFHQVNAMLLKLKTPQTHDPQHDAGYITEPCSICVYLCVGGRANMHFKVLYATDSCHGCSEGRLCCGFSPFFCKHFVIIYFTCYSELTIYHSTQNRQKTNKDDDIVVQVLILGFYLIYQKLFLNFKLTFMPLEMLLCQFWRFFDHLW